MAREAPEEELEEEDAAEEELAAAAAGAVSLSNCASANSCSSLWYSACSCMICSMTISLRTASFAEVAPISV